MNSLTRSRLLPTTLAVALAALASPVFAQEADAGIIAEATVPQDRLVERYADLAGSEAAAGTLVGDLRSGADFTVVEDVTRTTANPDGTTTTTVEQVERTIANPASPMGWGEVNISLSLARALLDSGAYPDVQSALTGIETTTTNPDGTTTVTSEGGVLAMRAEGMGWGAISKELGFRLGDLVSASNRSEKTAMARAGGAGKADKVGWGEKDGRAERAAGKPARVVRADRPDRSEKIDRPDRPGKIDRPNRPEKIDRPQRPERPERPQRPERGGRP